MENPKLVTIELNGKTYAGTWKVDGDMVTVRPDDFGDELRAHIADWEPHELARMLLRELIRKNLDLDL
jgi:hypothetical protein